MTRALADELRALPHTFVAEGESMAGHTTFGIGGPAEVFARPGTREDFIRAVILCRQRGVRLTVLGGGSNLLVKDEGIDGVALSAAGLQDLAAQGPYITAGAGVKLCALAEAACAAGLSGLAFAHGIPGTVGGGLYMNAGAYDSALSDVCVSAEVLMPEGVKTLTRDELRFAYRRSALQGNGGVVLSAAFALSPGDPAAIQAEMDALAVKRRNAQPTEPSAGSVFKRPLGHYAGKLIADSGLRGFAVGGAQVSAKHAGFIVNTGGATADEVLRLIRHIQDTVYARYKVRLETEIRVV